MNNRFYRQEKVTGQVLKLTLPVREMSLETQLKNTELQ